MQADDPRHGTYAGAVAHWEDGERTCDSCRKIANQSRKRRKYAESQGRPARVNAAATIRRLRALQSLGHSMPTVAALADLPIGTLHRLTWARNQVVQRATAEAVETAYNKLCMAVPIGHYVKRDRTRAVAKGWLPPLAWLDIEAGVLAPPTSEDNYVDHIVVERILNGDMTLCKDANALEREEVVARWTTTSSSSLADLERRSGWNVTRYLNRVRAKQAA